MGDVGRRGLGLRAGDAAVPGVRDGVGALRPRAGPHRPRDATASQACEQALALGDDPEVRDLRDQVARLAPRELKAA